MHMLISGKRHCNILLVSEHAGVPDVPAVQSLEPPTCTWDVADISLSPISAIPSVPPTHGLHVDPSIPSVHVY